jgi:hypothetical protein
MNLLFTVQLYSCAMGIDAWWFNAHDILLSKVRIQKSEMGGRGVFATEDMPSHFPIAIIPEHMTIRPMHVDLKAFLDFHKSKIAPYARSQLDKVSPLLKQMRLDDDFLLLALRLLELLRTDNEKWKPYKQLYLPERVPNFCFATPNEADQMLRSTSSASILPRLKDELGMVQGVLAGLQPPAQYMLQLVVPGTELTTSELS